MEKNALEEASLVDLSAAIAASLVETRPAATSPPERTPPPSSRGAAGVGGGGAARGQAAGGGAAVGGGAAGAAERDDERPHRERKRRSRAAADAALEAARHRVRCSAQCPLTAEEAIAEASAEGLALVQAKHPSGFRHVTYHKQSNKFVAKFDQGGVRRYLGSFHTPEEAALCVARRLRDHASAEDPMIVAAAAAVA